MTYSLKIKTRKTVKPMCYAYTTPQIRDHDGWTKIGYTEQDVQQRIAQQTQTADVKAQLEWSEPAIYQDGTGDTFRDKDFHTYLVKNEIERKPNTEWFKVTPGSAHTMFFDFTKNRGILTSLGVIEYTLRKEQAQAVQDTRAYFEGKSALDDPEFLWNAKPRFGKTLSAYDLCKQLNAQKVLIVTNRPAIANSWYDEYVTFLGTESGYYFVSQVDALKGKKFVLSREQYTTHCLTAENHRGCIEFVSLQDLKGSIYFGGQYDKLQEVATLEWDLLIIDEAHEGVDTLKTDVAFDHIKRRYTLHLSGTPFKALANGKFEDDAIFNWTYVDEQTAKRNWDPSSEEENPYAVMPTLNMYTYQMSDIIRDKLRHGADFNDDGEDEAYAFDLNEFFATNTDGTFKHEESVDKFLDALVTQTRFPFSTPELRAELNHTFWLLNRVDSAKALEKKLHEHPIFSEYEIILAAGKENADEDTELKKSFDKVKNAIQTHDKTITLSVGQLTTGVTIPQWTAVLMLSNVKSPSLYMQAAFRAQTPCLFNNNGELQRKENAYVFDFDPARTLEIFEAFANNLNTNTSGGRGDTETRKNNVRELLNFFPVYGEDSEGEMISLDPEKVLTIPRKIHAKEVIHRGFMSNFLFQNIHNLFNAPKAVIDAINGLASVKQPKPISQKAGDGLDVNPTTGDVEIPQSTIIGLATDVFGEKIYGEQQISDTPPISVGDPVEHGASLLDQMKQDCKDNIVTPLLDTAKEKFGPDMTKTAVKNIETRVVAAADLQINKMYADHQIKLTRIETEQKQAIESAVNKEDKQMVNLLFEGKKAELEQQFKQDIAEKSKDIIKTVCETIVTQVELHKQTKEKNKIEGEIRDHLRGFARSIPAFLMAYGDENTTLENFDTIIPSNVFEEITGISLDQFRMLRDGADYIDEETGAKKHFDGHLFDPIVFNDSVKEFLNLKKKLANYFEGNSTEDIFDYIPPQKTNQIFTPRKVVIEMVNNLESENPGCFDDPNKTFIDLYMKSGMYITEIVKRLYNSKKMKQIYPDSVQRLNHIFADQVYGLAPTEIIYRISTAYILGFDDTIHIEKHNFKCFDALPSAQDGTLPEKLNELYKIN